MEGLAEIISDFFNSIGRVEIPQRSNRPLRRRVLSLFRVKRPVSPAAFRTIRVRLKDVPAGSR